MPEKISFTELDQYLFGQFREWCEARELDWDLLNDEKHRDLQRFVKDLLHLYKKYPALHDLDHMPEGFQWINPDDADRSIFSFVRQSATKRNNILMVCNFTPVERREYRVGVLKNKQYKLIMNETGMLEKPEVYKAEKRECDNREFSLAYPLAPYGIGIFVY